MSGEWWAFILLMVMMKIPIVYLCAVIWWAVKEPRPEEGAAQLAVLPEPPPLRWRPWRLRSHRSRSGPHGSPTRRPTPAPRVGHAYAKHE